MATPAKIHDISGKQRGKMETPMQETLEANRHFGIFDLLKGESVVTSRTSDGQPAVIRVPHSLLAILVTVALACVGAGFWIVSSVTEMKTNLATIQRNQAADKATYSGNLRLMIAYSTNETNRIEFMKGLLTQAQQRQVFEWEKANPKPPLPSTDLEKDQ